MNKLFTKIATLSVGLAMAIGVGVAVGSNSKEATPVHATTAGSAYVEDAVVSAGGSISTGSTDYYVLKSTGGYYYTGVSSGWGNVSNSISNAVLLTLSGNASGFTIYDTAASAYLTYTAKSFTTGSTGTSVIVGTGTVSGTSYPCVQNGTTGVLKSNTGSSNKLRWYAGTSYATNMLPVQLIKVKPASTPLTSIGLSGTGVSSNAISIGSSDSTAHTINVSLTPSTATDQKVNIAHQSGTSGLFTKSASQITCSSGSGSFTITGTNATSGSETFRISGNTETGVYVDLVVTALDDSVTYYTVTFNSNGGSSSPAAQQVEEDDTFEFPSPGTKTHYSFDGWSSDGGTTKYAAGATSPAVGDDITYTAYWTENAKYTVTYVHGDHGTGDNYVVNNVYGGSYTLATFATAGFTASSGYAFKKWSVGGVEYAEGASITVSSATTVTAIYKTVDEYTLFTGALVEGDYVICSGTKAMKNETTSAPRIDVADVTVTNNKIVDPDSSIVWHIAQDGDYWTIYNAAVEKYAAFTSTNGRGTLIASVTDYARFTTSGSYEFINVEKSDKYLRYNATYGFASYATSTGVSLTLYKAPSNELSSIALSGDYKTSFNSGETFSFGGTVTASYTKDDPVNVTSSTTFHLDSSTGTNMSGVTMTHAAHDGHTIYAKYTEGGITKTATYEISVANAPVSSLTIASNTGKVVTKELFDMSDIGVTILPADAVQTYEWTVLSNTVNNDYTFEADIVEAGNTEGTITLKCTSTADSSKYQTFVLTVSGNPVVTLPNSVTLYTGKTTTVTASVEGGTSPYTYSWSITSGGSYASISSGGSSATVTLSGSAAGSVTLQCSVTDSNSKSDSSSVTFSVTASAVTEVNWSASAFDVFSGVTIPSNIDDTWEVNYEKNNGDNGYLVFGEYDLYLGSKEITSLPYTFVAEDDGKSLHAEYGGVSSSSVAVTVTQSINNVNAPNKETNTVSWTASEAADLGSKISSQGGTDEGTISTGDYEWDYTRTLVSLASNKSDYIAFQGDTWIQLGSGNALESIEFSTSAIPGTIKSVSVVAATAGTHALTIDVGGTKYLEDESLHVYTNTAAADNPDPAECVKTGTGSSSGTITITIAQSGSTKKAMVIRSISVTYETEGSGTTNIANVAAHKAAQRAAVAFANAFNAAMDETKNCTTGLDAAWSTCSSAYNSFKTAAAALGSTEEVYAKNLIKYATAQYSDDSGEACIERMMKTYEICVGKHGKTAFMDDLVSVGRGIVPVSTLISKNSSTAIIVIVTVGIAAMAIGGYFLLRKKKED